MTNRKSQAKPAKTEHSTGREAPAWKTSWPRGGDLRAWLRCMLRKCEAIVDIDDAASNAHFPIEGLHGLGHTKEAIRYVHRFLKRLPSTANVETVRMHELAAEIHLSAGDDAATEKHLGAVSKLDNSGARKCGRDFPEEAVRKFRVRHGLLNPADALDSEEAEEAEFNRAARLAKAFIDQRRPADAGKQVAIMERVAKATNDEFFRSVHRAAPGPIRVSCTPKQPRG